MPRDDSKPWQEAADNPLLGLANTEAEQSLLGAILVRNSLYETVVDIVKPSDFANGMHGRIFAAIGTLIDRGVGADPFTLKGHFDADGALSSIGGAQYLAQLATSVVTYVNAPYYAADIADLSRRRAIIIACQDAITDAATIDIERPTTAILEEFDKRLIDLGETGGSGDPVSIETAVDRALQAAERVFKADGKITGVTTGLTDLDRRLGGLHASELIVLAGRPGMGKTALATTISDNAARSGANVLGFQLEMSATDLAARQLGTVSGISVERQRSGPLSALDMTRLIEARQHFVKIPLTIDDTPAASVAQLRARARKHKRRHGLHLVVVDYLQLLLSDKARPENRTQEISAITRGLKMLAKELRVPVLALSQLSREVEKREDKRPILSDLRDSGSIEQDADVVLFLYRDEVYLRAAEPKQRLNENAEAFGRRQDEWNDQVDKAVGLADIIIGKNRQGSLKSVKVRFDPDRTVFENLAYGATGQ